MNARIMPDPHLRDRESMHDRERGKESVHTFEEAQPLQHGPPEYLERASCIVDAVVGKKVPHAVGDSGRYFFHQAILPFQSPSTHEIVGVSMGQKLQDVRTVLLEVAIDLDDDVSGRLIKARVERTGLTVVSVEVEYPNLGVLPRQAVQLFAAAIAAAIVHKDNFKRSSPRGRM